MNGQRFLSVPAAAALLGVSDVTLYRAIQAGAFPAIKIRGRYIIPSSALDAMEAETISTGRLVDAADYVMVKR